jgi:hypothetical protein
VASKKYRICGHGCVRPGSTLEETRINAGTTTPQCVPILFAMAGT